MRNDASLFKNRVIRKVAAALQVERRFGVAKSARAYGMVERFTRKAFLSMKAMEHERRKPVSEWIAVVPALLQTPNTAWKPPLKMSSLMAMTWRAPKTAFARLSEDEDGVEVVTESPDKKQEYVRRLAEAQDNGQSPVSAESRPSHQANSKGVWPHFTIRDSVRARMEKRGKGRKLQVR